MSSRPYYSTFVGTAVPGLNHAGSVKGDAGPLRYSCALVQARIRVAGAELPQQLVAPAASWARDSIHAFRSGMGNHACTIGESVFPCWHAAASLCEHWPGMVAARSRAWQAICEAGFGLCSKACAQSKIEQSYTTSGGMEWTVAGCLDRSICSRHACSATDFHVQLQRMSFAVIAERHEYISCVVQNRPGQRRVYPAQHAGRQWN